MHALAGGVPVSAFRFADLLALAGGSRRGCRISAEHLAGAGLEAIAEAPIDRLDDAAAVISAVRGAGLRVLRLTVQSAADRARVWPQLARDLQVRVGGFARVRAAAARMVGGAAVHRL